MHLRLGTYGIKQWIIAIRCSIEMSNYDQSYPSYGTIGTPPQLTAYLIHVCLNSLTHSNFLLQTMQSNILCSFALTSLMLLSRRYTFCPIIPFELYFHSPQVVNTFPHCKIHVYLWSVCVAKMWNYDNICIFEWVTQCPANTCFQKYLLGILFHYKFLLKTMIHVAGIHVKFDIIVCSSLVLIEIFSIVHCL